jgi:hypothetical protein
MGFRALEFMWDPGPLPCALLRAQVASVFFVSLFKGGLLEERGDGRNTDMQVGPGFRV